VERSDLNAAMEKLEFQNIRLTPQRYAVLEHVYATQGHLTVDDIYKSLASKYRNLSIATVYNNLKVFKRLGLVNEIAVGDSCRRYEAAAAEHYHISCTSCGVLVDVELLELTTLKAHVEKATGFVIEKAEMQGICPQCLKIKHSKSAG
jgi:Fur family peroxide stress response transcriptional regulator